MHNAGAYSLQHEGRIGITRAIDTQAPTIGLSHDVEIRFLRYPENTAHGPGLLYQVQTIRRDSNSSAANQPSTVDRQPPSAIRVLLGRCNTPLTHSSPVAHRETLYVRRPASSTQMLNL